MTQEKKISRRTLLRGGVPSTTEAGETLPPLTVEAMRAAGLRVAAAGERQQSPRTRYGEYWRFHDEQPTQLVAVDPFSAWLVTEDLPDTDLRRGDLVIARYELAPYDATPGELIIMAKDHSIRRVGRGGEREQIDYVIVAVYRGGAA